MTGTGEAPARRAFPCLEQDCTVPALGQAGLAGPGNPGMASATSQQWKGSWTGCLLGPALWPLSQDNLKGAGKVRRAGDDVLELGEVDGAVSIDVGLFEDVVDELFHL